ncbi:transcription elongation factor GreA [Candidatus Gracilibacteria bacterium]|nr:transcription elongation factor GreA [Candidatus Gracilibacteria bacterium]
MSKKKNYITREGYENLIQELEDLKKKKLPIVLERLAEAKAMGDLSENFEYKSAMEDKDFINSRVLEIEDLIDNIEIVESEKKKGEKIVDFGSTVTVKIEGDKAYDVTIVGTGEVSLDNAFKISFDSPLGSAIKGKKVGDEVKMRLPTGRKSVKVIAIK